MPIKTDMFILFMIDNFIVQSQRPSSCLVQKIVYESERTVVNRPLIPIRGGKGFRDTGLPKLGE